MANFKLPRILKLSHKFSEYLIILSASHHYHFPQKRPLATQNSGNQWNCLSLLFQCNALMKDPNILNFDPFHTHHHSSLVSR